MYEAGAGKIEDWRRKMKIAFYVLSGVISKIIVVDAVYIFKLVVDDIHDSYQRRQRRKYGKKED